MCRALEDEFELKGFTLYLYGSQMKGRSSSGQPDIDLMFYHPDLDKKGLGTRLFQGCLKIRRALDFRLDLFFGKQGNPHNAVEITADQLCND